LEYIDSTLKTSDDVEFYAKFPFLGYIPLGKRELAEKRNMNLISHTDPQSRIAEAFRNLKVSLLFCFPEDKPLRAIAITSSIPGEGKSFISSNLAIVFAQAKEPTLLIDADLRRSVIDKHFGIKNKSGLSSLLAGVSPLEEVIVPSSIPNLFLLPAGPYAPNPAELLGSERLPHILRELEKRFKRIVIDATPLLSVSDALLVGDKCDGLVFVIRAKHTALRYIMEAKKIADRRIKIIGAVLNSVDIEQRSYYYNYYYSADTSKDKT
jgi:capsular exopolysaccharide synthesis family protein